MVPACQRCSRDIHVGRCSGRASGSAGTATTSSRSGSTRRLRSSPPDTEEIRALLRGLAVGAPPPRQGSFPATRMCMLLLERGLVVDGDALLGSLPAHEPARGAVAAAFATYGVRAAEAIGSRLSARARVAGPPELASVAAALLADCGLTVDHRRPDLGLVVGIGEAPREEVDALLRAGVAHSLVVVREGVVEVGPFVLPGETACQRCVDAYAADANPRHALAVEQYAAPALRSDGVPEPVDPALLSIALGWAVRDLAAWADGQAPATLSTWSTTIEIDPTLTLPRTRWRPHPACGCTTDVRRATG